MGASTARNISELEVDQYLSDSKFWVRNTAILDW